MSIFYSSNTFKSAEYSLLLILKKYVLFEQLLNRLSLYIIKYLKVLYNIESVHLIIRMINLRLLKTYGTISFLIFT